MEGGNAKCVFPPFFMMAHRRYSYCQLPTQTISSAVDPTPSLSELVVSSSQSGQLDRAGGTPYYECCGRLRAAYEDVGEVAHIFLFSVTTWRDP